MTFGSEGDVARDTLPGAHRARPRAAVARPAKEGTAHGRSDYAPEPETVDAEVGRPEPRFVDYLVLSFHTATAFSPTDVSAVRRWAKLIMVLESGASPCLVALVFARAIDNI